MITKNFKENRIDHRHNFLLFCDTETANCFQEWNEEKGKISLGLKQTMPEPWSVIDDTYAVGQVVAGKVVLANGKLTNFDEEKIYTEACACVEELLNK